MSEATDLHENMTSEEISEYAASVAEEVAQERQGERKSDAEIVAGNSPAPKSSVEGKSDSESVKATGQDEESGKSVETAEWLTDDVKAEAAVYGISESEIADFTSREELDRALRLFDKSVWDAGQKALAENDKGTTRNEKGQFAKQEESPESETSEETGRFQVTLGDEYDEGIVETLTQMNDHLNSRLETIEKYFEQQNAAAVSERFDNLVDKLDHADLFGKSGKESPEELERRKELSVAVDTWLLGLQRKGLPAEMSEQLINRVANMAFADALRKKSLKQQTRKISKQSQLRQGGSPTKPQPPRDDPRDEADRLYEELSRS